MATPSIGDIVLCSQIAYRPLAAATIGRREAPRDLRELESILLGLSCSLNHLQEVTSGISPRNICRAPGTIDVQQHLSFMARSCRHVLEDLEKTTVKYRDTIRDPASAESLNGHRNSRVVKFKSQWRRFMWDLRGESLTRYRQKLETHTAAINLMLSTCIWSATDRIESDNRRQNERIETLLCQAFHSNGRFPILMQNAPLQVTSGHPLGSHRFSLLPALSEPVRE